MIPVSIVRLADRSAELVGRLISWCEINSGSGHLQGISRMTALLKEACLPLTDDVEGFTVSDDGRVAIRARRRPRAKIQVLLCGHYDTVYAASDPFQRCAFPKEGVLNGPGAADMKGGLIVLLAALTAFEETPSAANLGWEVLLTPDEETGSAASRPHLEEAARRHHFGLVFEPARENGDVVLARRGTGVATVVCQGRASHAGTAPQDGRNAILGLSEFILNTRRLAQDLPGIFLNVGRIEGGGPLNVVPECARAEFDVRVETSADWEALLPRLECCAAPINRREGYRIEIGLRLKRPPLAASPATESAFAGLARCGRDLGLAPFGWRPVSGASDANLLSAAGLPCLDGLGPRGGAYHSDREWIDLNSLVERSQLSALFLHRVASGDIPVSNQNFSI